MNNHLVNHIHHPELVHDSTLHVIRVLSNPARYHSRYRLARLQEEFLKSCPNIKLYTVEAAFGDRHHEVVCKTDPNHLLVRTNTEIWIKENMINLGVRHLLPANWKYVAWIDGDIIWTNKYWGLEAIHQLQHYPVIQPWTDGLDLGPHGNVMSHFKSFGHQDFHQFDLHLRNATNGTKHRAISGVPCSSVPHGDYRRFGHTGFAWACTRLFWENVGGLMDFCILGSADHNMALSCVGAVDFSIHKAMPRGFYERCHDWQRRALMITHKKVGSTHDRIEHLFHGKKKNRFYTERWKILVHYQFDPNKDLMYDSQGLLHLRGKPDLERAIMHYNRSRREDEVYED